MKSINHHNTAETPGRAMGHQKKVASSSGSSKAQKSGKKASNVKNPAAVQEDDKDSSASNRYKNYAGISARSVKGYWEQFNNHETDCQDDVYLRLAEDVTYKLWELGNALKVYSRHTGGKVTTDLVNVVLKDMNVAPVLGANSSDWDTLDCGGGYHFNSDRVVDLREEYLKEYQMLQPGPTRVTSTWVVEDEISEDLLDLFDKLCDAVFLGDEETFVAALEIADSHPFVCGILTLLLNKCSEMLAFDYKKGTLERTMKFLIALTGNSYLEQNHINLELYYLSQLMINLLLGADNDKYFESLPKLANGEDLVEGTGSAEEVGQGSAMPMQDFNAIVGNLMEYTEANATTAEAVVQPMIEETSMSNNNTATNTTTSTIEGMLIKTEAEETIKREKGLEDEAEQSGLVHSDLFNGIETATGELKHDYEALFIMMDNGEFGMKKVDEAPFQIKSEPMPEFVDTASTSVANKHLQILTELKQETSIEGRAQDAVHGTSVGVGGVSAGEDEFEGDESEEENEVADEEEQLAEEMCVITTRMCDTEDVALVCQCMGRLAGFWSYMYRECSYLLLKRVEQFFLGGVILLKCEYEWMVRAIQAVFALGEVPFREFSGYVDKLHITITPDWVTVQLNCCGVFLRDQQDGELYDLLYELCGDAILPFMLYRFMILKHLAEVSVRSRVIKYRIVSKVVPKYLNWSRESFSCREQKRSDNEAVLDSWFEERTKREIPVGKTPRIGFKFTGCRPMSVKREQEQRINTEPQKAASIDRSKVVIATRKLLRPLTNVKLFSTVYDLSSMHF